MSTPRYVVGSAAEATGALRRLARAGWHTREGFALPDLAWYTPEGREMTGEDWGNDFGRAVALFVNGEGIRERGQYGQRHVDSSFLLFFNAHDAPIEFSTPPA